MPETAVRRADLKPHVERLTENIARVHNLVSIYQALGGASRGRRSVTTTDVLRSAVVLLHAALEDFLRSVAGLCLPHAGADMLNSIPLKGTKLSGRAERFQLGHLVQHRGMKVEQLIKESVDEHLERSNYNNAKEITALLQGLGLDLKPIRRFFKELDKMIARRHQIVHRADCTAKPGRGRHRAVSLRVATVERWITVVNDFHGAVLFQIQQTVM